MLIYLAFLISLAIKATEVYICKYENNGENYVCNILNEAQNESEEEIELEPKESKQVIDSFTFEWPDLNF